MRELAREHTAAAVAALVSALKAESEGVRVAAAEALLNRGWGKPSQPIEGADGGPLVVEIVRYAEAK